MFTVFTVCAEQTVVLTSDCRIILPQLRAMKTAVPSDAGLQSTVVMGSAGGYQEASSEGDSVAWIRRKELGSGDDLGDDAYTLGTSAHLEPRFHLRCCALVACGGVEAGD